MMDSARDLNLDISEYVWYVLHELNNSLHSDSDGHDGSLVWSRPRDQINQFEKIKFDQSEVESFNCRKRGFLLVSIILKEPRTLLRFKHVDNIKIPAMMSM